MRSCLFAILVNVSPGTMVYVEFFVFSTETEAVVAFVLVVVVLDLDVIIF